MPGVTEDVEQSTGISNLRLVVLAVLAYAPRTGYQIGRLLRTELSHVWNARLQQVYAELATLSKRGLIAVVDEAPTGVKRRKVYALTDEGRDRLLAEVSWPQQPRPYRDDLLVKLYLLPLVPASIIVARLNDRRNQIEKELTAWRRDQEHVEPGNLGLRLTFEARLAVAEAELTWCRQAIQQLSAWSKDSQDNHDHLSD